MAVTITTIQPQDSLAASRLTLNSNFTALKAGVDAVQALVDPSTLTIQGIKAATINNGSVSTSTTVFQVGQGSSLLGNVIMGTTGASTSVLVNGNGGFTIDQSSLTLNTGNLTLSGASSVGTFGGSISITGELRLPGSATAFSSVIGLTSSPTTVSVTGLKYVVISNTSITAGLTASLANGTPGQVVEIFHMLGASGFPVIIDTLNFAGLTGGIFLTQTADTLRCVYDGASWYLWNYSPSSFATVPGGGATGSSITFTTL